MQCTRCGAERTRLHKHHIVPRIENGDNATKNIVRVCANCHEDLHEEMGKEGWRYMQTPEAIAKRIATRRRLEEDPEYRARVQAKRSASLKDRWENGVFGEMRNLKMGQTRRQLIAEGKITLPPLEDRIANLNKSRSLAIERSIATRKRKAQERKETIERNASQSRSGIAG